MNRSCMETMEAVLMSVCVCVCGIWGRALTCMPGEHHTCVSPRGFDLSSSLNGEESISIGFHFNYSAAQEFSMKYKCLVPAVRNAVLFYCFWICVVKRRKVWSNATQFLTYKNIWYKNMPPFPQQFIKVRFFPPCFLQLNNDQFSMLLWRCSQIQTLWLQKVFFFFLALLHFFMRQPGCVSSYFKSYSLVSVQKKKFLSLLVWKQSHLSPMSRLCSGPQSAV